MILAVCSILLLTSFESADVKVYVNGMRVNQPAYIQDGSTYIPLRAVSETMGAEVEWDAKTRSVYVSYTEDDAVSKLVEDVSKSVVTIVGNYDGDGDVYKYNNPTAHGSGVIYKSNGYIITNAHVVENIKNLTVVLNDGQSLAGKVLLSSTEADLAIVKIDKIGLSPVKFAEKSTILSGKTAIAIGTPISLTMRNTVTKGIVSGCDVALPDSHYKLIQTDAAINPGNSGGPLVNAKGELIGINSSKFVSTDIDNIGFAIPVDTVKHVISLYEKYGRFTIPDLGFSFDESWEAKIGLPTKKGLTVKKSDEDIIPVGAEVTKVGGVEVHSIADYNEAIKEKYDMDVNVISVTYIHNGETVETKIYG